MKSLKAFFRKSALWIILLPYTIFGLGALSNQVVLLANHGKFPVQLNTLKVQAAVEKGMAKVMPDGSIMLDGTHCVMTESTKLNGMADWIDLQSNGILSIGDVLIEFGDWLNGYSFVVWGTTVFIKLYENKE